MKDGRHNAINGNGHEDSLPSGLGEDGAGGTEDQR